jgi:hypothetical protein
LLVTDPPPRPPFSCLLLPQGKAMVSSAGLTLYVRQISAAPGQELLKGLAWPGGVAWLCLLGETVQMLYFSIPSTVPLRLPFLLLGLRTRSVVLRVSTIHKLIYTNTYYYAYDSRDAHQPLFSLAHSFPLHSRHVANFGIYVAPT